MGRGRSGRAVYLKSKPNQIASHCATTCTRESHSRDEFCDDTKPCSA